MASMTFQVNDASTSGGSPAVWVTITENGDGTLNFTVTQQGGIVGDLRGVFFDLRDEGLIGTLTTNAVTSDFRQGNDSVRDLGNGANMNGLLGSDGGYDAGIEIGTAGIGNDDIQSYSFTLDSSARDLTLQDFANVDFGVRLTSVGTIGGARNDSSKIMETTSAAIDARDDSASVQENAVASGNVLANDAAPEGVTTFTGWQGGSGTIALANAAGTTLTLNADGSWTVDASTADALSEGETLTYSFSYSARNQTEATSWSDDSAVLTVTVTGSNDGPVAGDDDAGRIAEDGVINASVRGNDSDVDRLDTHTWSLVEGSFDGEGTLTFNADGTWSYSAGGAYDYLNDGEQVELSFQYRMADNHGGTDTATVRFGIDGAGTVTPPPPPPVDTVDVFLFNHGSNEFDHGWFPQLGDNTAEGFDSNDILFIAGDGSPVSMTVSFGDYGHGDPDLDDTMFVLDYVERVRGQSTLTQDVGYLVDYDALTAEQIRVAGNFDESSDLFFT